MQVNILLVDDRPENVLAMKSLLDSPDYRLIAAYSGEEALRCILKEDFALILLDVQMPGLSGFDTAKLIKAREKSRHIPIIFVTALSQATENVIQGYEAGAIDFIFKPFHPSALRYKVDAFVNMYRYRQQLKQQNEVIRSYATELEITNARLTATAEELHRTEALARMALETSADTILTLREDGTVIEANPSLEKMFGIRPEELIGTVAESILPNCAIPRGGMEGDSGEGTALHKDGTAFPVEVQKGEARVGGKSIYVYTIRDITLRKQLEAERERQLQQMEQLVAERTEEVRASRDQLSDILESITDSFLTVDNQWRLLYINRVAERLLGVRREDVLGQNVWDVYPAHDMMHQLLHKSASEKLPLRFEVFSSVSDSWLEIRTYPTAQGMSVYLSDLSERKQMEEDIRHSQERFYKIFQSSPSLIAIYSTVDGRYIDVNQSWIRHTGYTYKEAMERRVDLKLTVESPDRVVPLDAASVVKDEKVIFVTKSGETRTGLLSTEIIDIQGEPCMLTVITDITDRMELERELARLDRLHLIGEMAAGIAHEIRNPMTTVRGFLQMAKSNSALPSSDIIDLMVDELNRANMIITEFLTLAKNKTTDRKKQSLNGIVETMFPLIQAEATMTNKSVELQLSPTPELLLDEKEIRQMLLNLTLNGLEAMEAGGLLIIRSFADPGSRAVFLEVQDQGRGIEKEVLDKLGTPFFTTKDQGTGLGLAVCYSIVARHNARLEVQTGEGGTTFRVRFEQTPRPVVRSGTTE